MSDTPRDTLSVETREDLVLIRRAVREGWLPPDRLLELRDRMMDVSRNGKTPTLRLGAAKVAVQIEKLCLDGFVHVHNVEMKVLDKEIPDKHDHTHHVDELRKALAEGREDERYVQLERERALKNGSQPGVNGHNGHAGPMGNGAAPRFG